MRILQTHLWLDSRAGGVVDRNGRIAGLIREVAVNAWFAYFASSLRRYLSDCGINIAVCDGRVVAPSQGSECIYRQRYRSQGAAYVGVLTCSSAGFAADSKSTSRLCALSLASSNAIINCSPEIRTAGMRQHRPSQSS